MPLTPWDIEADRLLQHRETLLKTIIITTTRTTTVIIILSQTQQCMTFIPALPEERGRGRWLFVFEAILVYRASSKTASAIQRNPVLGREDHSFLENFIQYVLNIVTLSLSLPSLYPFPSPQLKSCLLSISRPSFAVQIFFNVFYFLLQSIKTLLDITMVIQKEPKH